MLGLLLFACGGQTGASSPAASAGALATGGGDWLVSEAEVHVALLEHLRSRDDVWVALFGEVVACVKRA